MTVSLAILIGVIVVAMSLATYALISERSRRVTVARAAGDTGASQSTFLRKPTTSDREVLQQRLLEKVPSTWAQDERMRDRLVHAGFDSDMAPLVFAVARLAFVVLLPIMAFLLVPASDPLIVLVVVIWAAMGGWLIPNWWLLRMVSKRQDQIRRSLPDALDLLVVCVEAGISVDAAMLRVAKDLTLAHPELAREFLIINRKVNAGMPREEALRGLWERTDVEEVRALVSSVVQSEKWGTSIARVLRVFADTLRRKRRQIIEQKAAVAPMKMLFPLIFLIFPALFIIALGPAVMNVLNFLRSNF
jgi:tight adherence protein C